MFVCKGRTYYIKFPIKTAMFSKIKIYMLGVLLIVIDGCFGELRMEDYCNMELSFILHSLYQTKLQLTDDYLFEKPNTRYPYETVGYCETNVEAWITIFSKLMFYFEDLNIDCDKGHLEFYDDENSNIRVQGLEYNVCGKTKPEGVYTVNSRFMRIKYVPVKRQYISDIFSIIITIFSDEGSCPSYGHVCDNSRCIDEDIKCNGYDSCGDGSGCDLTNGVVIGIVIGSIVGVGLIISIAVCCFCCMRRSKGTTCTVQNTASNIQSSNLPMYPVNQGSSYPTNITPYPPYAAQTNLTNQDVNQPGSIRPIYGYNDGTNYQSNQAPYNPHENTSGYLNPSAPPPSYDEIMANSEK